MKLLMKVLLAASVLACATASNANLIVNGGFEDSDVGTNQWEWFTSVNGWEGSTVEVWDSLQDFDSHEGDQHAELNAHNNGGGVFSIYQSFATTAGFTYDVSFAYAARTNIGEQFSYAIEDGSSIIDSMFIDNNLVKQWSVFNSSFIATGSSSKIVFTSVIPDTGTVGNFLDSIYVTTRDNIVNASAPASIALILAGMFGLIFSRRKTY